MKPIFFTQDFAESSLTAYLSTALSTVTPVPEIYYLHAPQTARYPFVLIDLEGRDIDHPKNARKLVYDNLDLSVYARLQLQAITTGKALKTALDALAGYQDITLVRISNEFDDQEKDTGSYIRHVSVQLNYLAH